MSGSEDCTVRVLDVETGECVILGEDVGWICSVSISPDGRLVAAASPFGSIFIWDVLTCKLIEHIEVRSVNSVAFTPDGKGLISTTFRSPQHWDLSPLLYTDSDLGTVGNVIVKCTREFIRKNPNGI